MRIGFDSKRLYCNFSGLGNYSRTLVRNLKQYFASNEYYLYTSKIRHTPDTDYFMKRSGCASMVYGGMLKSLWRSYLITHQLKKDKIDLYHGLSNEIPVRMKNTGIKSVVTIHDLIFRKYPETYPFIDRQIYDIKFRHSCAHADRIIAVSQSTKNDIIEYYKTDPGKIDVIYQSCNPLYYAQQDDEQSKLVLRAYTIPEEYILYVGNIEERKNLKLIIDAFRCLPPDRRIPLVIIGRGNKYKKEILDSIVSAGVGQWVQWIDNMHDDSHLQAIYQNAMCLIYPSIYEGFGLPVVEALLSKTPVITSNTSSLPEAGGPDSIYIDPFKVDELANAIETVLGNTELRTNMKERGFLFARKNFDPTLLSGEMISTYKNVLSQTF